MNIERALTIRNSLKTRIADCYSIAVICGMDSSELNAACINARNEQPKGTPQWVFSYCDGYQAALQDSLYSNCLVYGGFIDGVFYSTHRNRHDYYEKHGIDAVDYADNGRVTQRGHYWRESINWRNGIYNRDTVKPYFIG